MAQLNWFTDDEWLDLKEDIEEALEQEVDLALHREGTPLVEYSYVPGTIMATDLLPDPTVAPQAAVYYLRVEYWIRRRELVEGIFKSEYLKGRVVIPWLADNRDIDLSETRFFEGLEGQVVLRSGTAA
jgi:hypothetical protein